MSTRINLNYDTNLKISSTIKVRLRPSLGLKKKKTSLDQSSRQFDNWCRVATKKKNEARRRPKDQSRTVSQEYWRNCAISPVSWEDSKGCWLDIHLAFWHFREVGLVCELRVMWKPKYPIAPASDWDFYLHFPPHTTRFALHRIHFARHSRIIK